MANIQLFIKKIPTVVFAITQCFWKLGVFILLTVYVFSCTNFPPRYNIETEYRISYYRSSSSTSRFNLLESEDANLWQPVDVPKLFGPSESAAIPGAEWASTPNGLLSKVGWTDKDGNVRLATVSLGVNFPEKPYDSVPSEKAVSTPAITYSGPTSNKWIIAFSSKREGSNLNYLTVKIFDDIEKKYLEGNFPPDVNYDFIDKEERPDIECLNDTLLITWGFDGTLYTAKGVLIDRTIKWNEINKYKSWPEIKVIRFSGNPRVSHDNKAFYLGFNGYKEINNGGIADFYIFKYLENNALSYYGTCLKLAPREMLWSKPDFTITDAGGIICVSANMFCQNFSGGAPHCESTLFIEKCSGGLHCQEGPTYDWIEKNILFDRPSYDGFYDVKISRYGRLVPVK